MTIATECDAYDLGVVVLVVLGRELGNASLGGGD